MPHELVGLVPAAGLATRLGRLPCSKEIYPLRVGSMASHRAGEGAVTVAAEFLLSQFREAGARKAFVVLRDGKWDIPAYLGDGHHLGLSLGYLQMRHPFGAAFTLDAAFPFVAEAQVLLGFPDIVIDLEDPYGALVARASQTGADIVLGLLPARRPEKVDMVDLDDEGRIRDIVIKPSQTNLRYTWLVACWGPRFSRFLHDFVQGRLAQGASLDGGECHVGDVVRRALQEGFDIESVRFDGASYIDIGTPEDLRFAVRR